MATYKIGEGLGLLLKLGVEEVMLLDDATDATALFVAEAMRKGLTGDECVRILKECLIPASVIAGSVSGGEQ